MKHNPITVTPDTTTLQAVQTMRRHKVACLPVTQNGKLVGIVTEHDLINIAASMLEHQLKDEPSP